MGCRRDQRDNGTLALRYFSESDFSLPNSGRTISELKRLGYRGYPGFRLSENTHREGVYEAFMRRLPPRSRPDFAEYRHHFRLKPNIAISDFALLGRTEAKLPSDGFSIVSPLDCGGDQLELLLEVAGHRYHATNPPAITVDDPVTFVAEPDNKVDPDAIMICRRGRCIGYVNRLQTKAFHRWLANNQVDGVVERLNGHPERPRVFVFVKIRPKPQERAA